MNTKLRRVFITTFSNNQLSKSPSYPKSNRQTGAKNGVAAEQTWVLGDWRWGGGWQKLRFCSSCTLPPHLRLSPCQSLTYQRRERSEIVEVRCAVRGRYTRRRKLCRGDTAAESVHCRGKRQRKVCTAGGTPQQKVCTTGYTRWQKVCRDTVTESVHRNGDFPPQY